MQTSSYKNYLIKNLILEQINGEVQRKFAFKNGEIDKINLCLKYLNRSFKKIYEFLVDDEGDGFVKIFRENEIAKSFGKHDNSFIHIILTQVFNNIYTDKNVVSTENNLIEMLSDITNQDNFLEKLTTPSKIPWYLEEFYHSLVNSNEQHKHINITIHSCNQYYYYSLTNQKTFLLKLEEEVKNKFEEFSEDNDKIFIDIFNKSHLNTKPNYSSSIQPPNNEANYPKEEIQKAFDRIKKHCDSERKDCLLKFELMFKNYCSKIEKAKFEVNSIIRKYLDEMENTISGSLTNVELIIRQSCTLEMEDFDIVVEHFKFLYKDKYSSRFKLFIKQISELLKLDIDINKTLEINESKFNDKMQIVFNKFLTELNEKFEQLLDQIRNKYMQFKNNMSKPFLVKNSELTLLFNDIFSEMKLFGMSFFSIYSFTNSLLLNNINLKKTDILQMIDSKQSVFIDQISAYETKTIEQTSFYYNNLYNIIETLCSEKINKLMSPDITAEKELHKIGIELKEKIASYKDKITKYHKEKISIVKNLEEKIFDSSKSISSKKIDFLEAILNIKTNRGDKGDLDSYQLFFSIFSTRSQKVKKVNFEKLYEDLLDYIRDTTENSFSYVISRNDLMLKQIDTIYSDFQINNVETSEYLYYQLNKTCKQIFNLFYSVSENLIYEPFFIAKGLPKNSSEIDYRGLVDTFYFLLPSMVEIMNKNIYHYFKTKKHNENKKIINMYNTLSESDLALFDVNIINSKSVIFFEFLSNTINDFTNLFKWFEIKINCMLQIKNNSILNLKIISVSIDHIQKIIVIPPDNLILVSSKNVRVALADLAKVWLSKSIETILILGWTGSGKEVLIKAISNSMFKLDTIFFSAPTIKDYSKSFVQEINDKYAGKDCIIVIDEIHHDSALEFRTNLLRTMESDELKPHRKLFVLAGSISKEKFKLLPPKDLLTRIEQIVILKHPFLIENNDERREIIKDYFLLFWNKYFNSVLFVESTYFANIKTIFKTLLREEDDYEKLSNRLANVFINEIDSPLLPMLSIRSIRSLVKKLFNSFILSIRFCENPKCNCSLNCQNLLSCDLIFKKFEKEIKTSLNEIITDPDIQSFF